jgi:hypothetical protein
MTHALDSAGRLRWFHFVLLAGPLGCTSPAPQSTAAPVAGVRSTSVEAQVLERERASQPGKRHRELDVLIGRYATALVARDESGAETEIARGTAEIESILGGRYLRWNARLDIAGAEHATTGFLGYDLGAEEYQLTMVSDLSTGMVVARGDGSLERAGILWTLDQVDARDGTHTRMTSRLRLLAPGHFVLDQIAPQADGSERIVHRTHHRRMPDAEAP